MPSWNAPGVQLAWDPSWDKPRTVHSPAAGCSPWLPAFFAFVVCQSFSLVCTRCSSPGAPPSPTFPLCRGPLGLSPAAVGAAGAVFNAVMESSLKAVAASAHEDAGEQCLTPVPSTLEGGSQAAGQCSTPALSSPEGGSHTAEFVAKWANYFLANGKPGTSQNSSYRWGRNRTMVGTDVSLVHLFCWGDTCSGK